MKIQTKGATSVKLRSRGTYDVPTTLLAGDEIAIYRNSSFDGSNYITRSNITSKAIENHSAIAGGTDLILQATDIGSIIPIDKNSY